MEIYHGSSIVVEKPEIIIGKFTKDFGYAFYCTKMQQQAEKWARRNDNPIVNIYEYTEDSSLSIKQFDEMTEEWLDLIINCRNGGTHEYDIVIGPMADDKVYNFVAGVMDGSIPREVFWAYAKFVHPTHHIAFCTPKALNTIKFKSSYEVDNGEKR